VLGFLFGGGRGGCRFLGLGCGVVGFGWLVGWGGVVGAREPFTFPFLELHKGPHKWQSSAVLFSAHCRFHEDDADRQRLLVLSLHETAYLVGVQRFCPSDADLRWWSLILSDGLHPGWPWPRAAIRFSSVQCHFYPFTRAS